MGDIIMNVFLVFFSLAAFVVIGLSTVAAVVDLINVIKQNTKDWWKQ